MATLNEIAYSIRNQLTGFVSSDDERIDIELIYKKVRDVRSLLIKEEYELKKFLDPALYQRIECLKIKCKEFECEGKKSGEFEYYIDLPKAETYMNDRAIRYLGTADLKTPFVHRPVQGLSVINYNRWTAHSPSYTRLDDKAILNNIQKDLCFVSVVMVKEDPLESLDEHICKADDEYPLPGYMIHKLELLVIKQFAATLGIKPDETNNARGDLQREN